MVGFFRRLSMLLGRDRFRAELDEEMAFHRAEAEREFVAQGMSPKAARRAALRQFGNVPKLQERSHEEVGFRLETVVQDVRFALRQMGRNRGFAVTATGILALGIGSAVAIFAFVDAALIQPLPYPDPTRLVGVAERGENFPISPLSFPDFADWKRRNTVFSSLAAYTPTLFGFREASGTEPVPALRVSAEFFRTLGVRPELGRDFANGEDVANGPKLVILSHAAWQKRFEGKSTVVGQAIELSGNPYTIVGVLPESFQFAPRGATEFWVPLQPDAGCELRRSCHGLSAIGRLKDGVSVASAQAAMQSIAEQLQREYPDSNRGQDASVVPLSEVIVGEIRPILLTLMGGAGMLLLIACVNVASLLLVRFESRRREIAVRGALGASRLRLMRQFVTEAAGLVMVACAAALALAYGGMRILTGLLSKEMMAGMPFLKGIGLNAHVLLFAAALALVVLVLFAFTPVLYVSDSQLQQGLNEGSRGSAGLGWRRLGSHLVVVELATAVVLLTGAGLLGKSLYRLVHAELGFAADHLATVDVSLPGGAFATDAKIVQFSKQLVEQAERLPGVKSVALTSMLPVSCNCNTDWVRFVGKPYNGIHNEVNSRDVTPGFLNTLGAKLAKGRTFTEADDATKPSVILINQAFAKKYYPGEDPIGKRLGNTDLGPKSIREIVGVIADIKDGGLAEEQWPTEYAPIYQSADTDFSLVVRTEQKEETVLPLLTALIHSMNRDVVVQEPTTMSQRINDSYAAYIHRSTAWLVGGFGAVALLLGVVGLYGVVAYSVSQRTREIGVRMALGASQRSVHTLILREAGWLTGAGIALGLISSVAIANLMRKLLFGTNAWDVSTLVAVAILLGTAALVASYIPARRAARVNPIEALRAE